MNTHNVVYDGSTAKKPFSLKQLCQGLDVTIQGDPNDMIQGVCTIDHAKPHHLTFLMNPLYRKYLSITQASAVILTAGEAVECPSHVNAIICQDPYFTYAKIAAYFDDKPLATIGVHPSVVVGENCYIHPTASVGAYVTLGNHVVIAAGVVISAGCHIGDHCVIGENTRLDARVTLYHRVRIGKRTIIASGAVMGSDGFGNAKHKGVWLKVPQLGGVLIGDDVEIGANTTIDRGAIEDTVLENGVKLDNLIQIGHNARVGENTAIAGCTGVAGSAIIGKNCLIGGNAGIAGHITITDNVMITGMSEISKSIREPGIYSTGVGGVVTNTERRKISARVHRLDKMAERVKLLELAVQALTVASGPDNE